MAKMGKMHIYMPWCIGHAWSEFLLDLHAVFFVGKPIKFSFNLYQYDIMFAMDPRVVLAESRFFTFFFTKNCKKIVVACLLSLQMRSYELFLRAWHLRNTTSVNNDHSNQFKLVSDALFPPQKTEFSKEIKPSGGGGLWRYILVFWRQKWHDLGVTVLSTRY